jgi:hypothetical protein
MEASWGEGEWRGVIAYSSMNHREDGMEWGGMKGREKTLLKWQKGDQLRFKSIRIIFLFPAQPNLISHASPLSLSNTAGRAGGTAKKKALGRCLAVTQALQQG